MSAYPNPFKEHVTIEFNLAETGKARMELLSIDGRVMDILYNGNVNADQLYKVNYLAKDNANGMYFYRLITESGEVHIKKLVLMK